MGRSVKALATPAVLTWAREELGLSVPEVAVSLKVPSSDVEAWERGVGQMSVVQLRRLAALYRRPLSFFYLPAPPAELPARPPDFRRHEGEANALASNILLQLRKLRERRTIALDLAEELQQPIPAFDLVASLNEPSSEVARRIRTWIGISVKTQSQWANPGEALRHWRAALEARGVLTLQFTDVPVREVRGLSVSDRPLPIIAVNSKDSPAARCFTLFHELMHIMLNQGGLCDFVGSETRKGQRDVERFCNDVAAQVLAPSDALKLPVASDPEDPLVRVAALATRLKISKEAMTLRLITAGELKWSQYEAVRTRHFEEVDEAARKLKDSDGGPSRATLAIANLGAQFLRLVVAAYREGLVGAPEFADFTTVRVKHLSTLEAAVGEL